MRTGRYLVNEPREAKFNPWHDPDDGRFTFANQGRYFERGGAGAPANQLARPPSSTQTKPTGPNQGTIRAEREQAARENRERQAREHREREAFKRHMIPNEGYRNDVYRDSKGIPTVGIGHKVTPADKLKVGDRISDARADALWQQDSKRALDAAKRQMREAGISDPAFLPALADVNFQLGTGWHDLFRRTWDLIRGRRYGVAALEAEHSEWFKQTPKRARAFREALERLELAEEVRRKRKAEEARRKREGASR